jgi:uncharacterized protein with PQ loop repeat
MTINHVQFIGLLGSSTISIAFIPQTYLIVKSGNTKDISLVFVCLNLLASSLMLYYGISTLIVPIIISNTSVFTNNSIIAILTLRNRWNSRREKKVTVDAIC